MSPGLGGHDPWVKEGARERKNTERLPPPNSYINDVLYCYMPSREGAGKPHLRLPVCLDNANVQMPVLGVMDFSLACSSAYHRIRVISYPRRPHWFSALLEVGATLELSWHSSIVPWILVVLVCIGKTGRLVDILALVFMRRNG